MVKKVLAASYQMRKGELDDDYILYENGEIEHNYDKSRYPGQYNLTEKLKAGQISYDVKKRLLNNASVKNKDAVRKILGLNEQ
jgi:hypothetical protein